MKTSHGFSLVEIAVVLFIISIFMGSFIIPYHAKMEQGVITDTDQRLEEIKEALIGFAILNERLPCPDIDGDGIEEVSCNIEGNLPWVTLGVGKFVDGWGNNFRYRVDDEYSQYPIPKSSLFNDSPNTSDLKVENCQEELLTSEQHIDPNPPNKEITSNVVAIIFSYGKNNSPDAKNSDDDGGNYNIYMQAARQVKCGSTDIYFDDILVWLPKTILINRLVVTGKWP